MLSVLPAEPTVLFDFQTGLFLFVLGRRIIPVLATLAGKCDYDPHVLFSPFNHFLFNHLTIYSIILVTTPAPTVLPPSRMANRKPSSIATGVISSTSKLALSPGITISIPSGNFTIPVTSVVRM